ncbi:Tetratricopeptide repeat-containing protein [Ekhidna lutea]|uniref:histidine kinase n=1 Tax=Ekhidna lutea TaxID=447679 RepID=A0A239F5F3_EKHLU|nr:tetratricopeptide repeat-containing sensor histidine kinase [Ekhidna lutea]SNS51738.1 Tetratricopeptide repeat-containing protein [Ekhidna lutea]
MKPSAYFTLIVLSVSVFAQEIDQNLLEKVAEIRKTNCDSALALILQTKLKSMPDSRLKAWAFLELGYTHYCLGSFDSALESYQTSLDLYVSLNTKSKPSEILNLIGTLQKKQGDFDLAQDYFNQGLDYAIAQNDSIGIGNSLNNIGVLLFQQEKFQESLDYYLRSTEVKSAISDTIGLSYNYDNLGMAYTKLNKIDSAQYYFELAAEYKLLIGDEAGYGIVKNNIGEMFFELQEYDQAEVYFLEALKIAQKVSYADFEQYVLSMIATVQEQRGDYKKALAYFKDHVSLKDSLFNDRRSKQVAELETKYQTEKKEAEIQTQQAEIQQKNSFLIGAGTAIFLLILLFLQNRQRTKLKAEKLVEEHKRMAREAEIRATITSQEKERSRYARDLHDGFGQMISILNMNLKNLNDGAKPNERQKVFEESSKVIDDMYGELKNICFDLMPQTLIKNGLESALQEFVGRINQAGNMSIELNVFGLDQRLSELQEISLYRISQEWINNILKYSDAKKVTLQITKDEDEITLLIEDDGAGFDRNLLTSGKGNGWKNLNTRTNLIRGKLELETHPETRGNSLIINIPVQTELQKEVEQNTMEMV